MQHVQEILCPVSTNSKHFDKLELPLTIV